MCHSLGLFLPIVCIARFSYVIAQAYHQPPIRDGVLTDTDELSILAIRIVLRIGGMDKTSNPSW